MIQTDIFIKMGISHKICEDYIIQGMNPEPFIILSDGCSSSYGTEMGARILCHLAKQYLRYRVDDLHSIKYEKLGSWVIHNAEMTVRQLGLKLSCLDATLIVAFQLEDEIRIFIYGDGMIAVKKDDDIVTHSIDFTNNAPYYLSYLVDDHRHKLYHEMKNEKILTSQSTIAKKHSSSWAYDNPTIFTYHKDSFDVLFIASDGLASFIVDTPNEYTIIKPEEILPAFMTFKNLKGEYLKRRLNKALKGFYNTGINHFDDLSIGSFISVKED